jgi:hypothetical protein
MLNYGNNKNNNTPKELFFNNLTNIYISHRSKNKIDK